MPDAPPGGNQAPPTTQKPPADWVRPATNAAIVIASFIIVLMALHMILTTDSLKGSTSHLIDASTVVAILGAVTTFLGTAVGVFFGVNVGQAGQAAATQAATSSAAAATAASHATLGAAAAASDAAKAANDATQAANSAATTASQNTSRLVEMSSAVSALASAVPQNDLDSMEPTFKSALASFRGEV